MLENEYSEPTKAAVWLSETQHDVMWLYKVSVSSYVLNAQKQLRIESLKNSAVY